MRSCPSEFRKFARDKRRAEERAVWHDILEETEIRHCPFCRRTNLYADFVDVGVGGEGIRVTPYECLNCGAMECTDDQLKDDLWIGFRKDGWLPGYDEYIGRGGRLYEEDV